MTDIHSHVLFSLDDGSYSIEESLELLKKMKSLGYNNIILTPHYIKGSDYNANNERKRNNFYLLKEAIKEQNLNINIYLGNEIFITDNIPELIEQDEISSLNHTRYLLIEFPFHNQILNLEDIIYEIKLKGYIPVIAHPERYTYFQDNYDLVEELKDMDVLFQCNYVSILGYYGKSAEKLFKYLLKKRYVSFLGSDIHHLDRAFFIDNYPKIIKHITKVAGKDYFDKIMENCNNLVSPEK